MSDRPNGAAPAAADTGAAPAGRPEHTEFQVASVLEGLLDKPDDDVEAQNQEAPDTGDGDGELDAGPDESPATSEDDDGQSDPEEAPAIDPPKSLSADERKAWSELPRAAQEMILRRDSAVTARLHKGTQEIAEERRAHQAQLDEANNARSQYAQNLATFRDVLLPDARTLEGVDWARLSVENPAEYIRLSALRDATRDRFAWINGEIQRVQQSQNQEMAQRTEKMRQQGRQALIDALPDFGDEEKGPKLAQKFGSYLRKQGFTDQEIGSVVDHRALLVTHKAMLWDEAQQARQTVQQKRTPKPAAQVQRPGSSPPTQDGKQRRSAQLVERFGQTRSVQDAARVVETWMPS